MKTKQNTYKISVLVILIRYNEYFLSKATTQKIRLFNDDHVESRKPKPISFLRNGPSNNDLEDNFSSTTAHVLNGVIVAEKSRRINVYTSADKISWHHASLSFFSTKCLFPWQSWQNSKFLIKLFHSVTVLT